MTGEVTDMRNRGKNVMEADEGWLRRQALIIAGQLPENQKDALAVLDLTKEIVCQFFRKPA